MYTDLTFTYVSDQLNTKPPSASVFVGSFAHLFAHSFACRPNAWSIMVKESTWGPADSSSSHGRHHVSLTLQHNNFSLIAEKQNTLRLKTAEATFSRNGTYPSNPSHVFCCFLRIEVKRGNKINKKLNQLSPTIQGKLLP